MPTLKKDSKQSEFSRVQLSSVKFDIATLGEFLVIFWGMDPLHVHNSTLAVDSLDKKASPLHCELDRKM